MAKAPQVVLLENEFYLIKAPNGKVLEIKNFNTENGAAIRLWDYAGHPWQQWQFVDAGEGRWRIRNRFTGKFIVEEVMNLGCLCRPVWTDGITRINTYVNDGQHEYGILNPGAPITPQHQEELYNILDTAGDLECLIVSGSVPPKATPDFLAKVMEHAQARGADVVLDLSSDKLKELAHKKPLLIKPNHHEMKAIFGVPVDTDDEVRVAMKMAHDAGVQNVLLTRGSRGDAYFSNGEDIWYAKREFNIKLVSSVCAGDCTLAAFLHKWYRDRDNVEEAMKLAMATGANVAESVGIGDFGHVDEYSKRVAVRKLDRQ